jgi:pimeloyl-ACP methyl ester carboxylesterase
VIEPMIEPVIEPTVPDPVPPVVSRGARLPWRGRAVLRGIGIGLSLWAGVAPRRAADACHRLYFKIRRSAPHPLERALIAQATPLEIPWQSPPRAPYPVNGALRGWMWGAAGPVVMLVHGWQGRGSQMARSYADPLVQAGFRVVAVDMPGHGGSVGDRSDLRSFVTAIQHTADRVGPLAGAVGHSLGATALAVALAEGLACPRLVGVGMGVWLETLPERFCNTLHVSRRLRAAFLRRLFETFPAPEWRAWSADAIAPSMTVPALFIHDRDDLETSYTGSVAVARLWPNARLHLTDGHGHNRVLAAPRVVSDVVSFLRDG